ncbi:hypothetical protein [Luteimonas sp. MJ250]|uniref:pirin family protein n=1 Tax=Luteimonas sp. MJ250 TaxID=3129236 RepID=UPI0031B9EA4A
MSAAGSQAAAVSRPRPRPAAARAHARRDGIVATEAFSRGDAITRDWMGWGALRVLSRQHWAPGINRDDGRVANMERLLLVLEGALEADCGALGRHRLEAGDLLWISTGHGLPSRVSNRSATAPLRLVECWLQPGRVNATPAVACRSAGGFDADGAWVALAAGDRGESGGGNDDDSGNHAGNAGGGNGVHINTSDSGPLPLRQRARLMAVRIAAGAAIDVPACRGGRCWLEVLDGGVAVSGHDNNDDDPRLASGDGIAWTAGSSGAPSTLTATAAGTAWLLLFVLPA